LLDEGVYREVGVLRVVPLGAQVKIIREEGQQRGVAAGGIQSPDALACGYIEIRRKITQWRAGQGARGVHTHLDGVGNRQVQVEVRQQVAVLIAGAYRDGLREIEVVERMVCRRRGQLA